MARVLAHHVRKDMALLSLCELLLSAVFIYMFLLSSDVAPRSLAARIALSWNKFCLASAIPLAIVALLIELDNPGPVFYRQERTRLRGRPFILLKLRGMRADAEASGTPRWARKRDPRITPIGHIIRQTRIDELPQLLNGVRGDRSMIRPRPERSHFVEEPALAIPFYHKREAVRPGITGQAQVNYTHGASVEEAREKLACDLYYVKNRSILLAIAIPCSTVQVILFREGAC